MDHPIRYILFAGLAEGVQVGSFGEADWFIDYQAGDGNVVSLFTVASLTADFDGDDDIDGDDLAQWEVDFGPGTGSHADGFDFLTWQQQYENGVISTATSQAVPEPGALGMLAIDLLLSAKLSRRNTLGTLP